MPTYTELMRGFEFGPWEVIPERGLIRDGDNKVHVEPLVMDVSSSSRVTVARWSRRIS